MKLLTRATLLLTVVISESFCPLPSSTVPTFTLNMESSPPNISSPPTPFSMLPGDPTLILFTNVDLGDNKMDIMKASSKAIEKANGKPEAYIAVTITDKAALIFAGSDEPAAVGCLYSIGGIAQASNGQITASVADLLQPYGVNPSRIYINFFDVPRANVGWNRGTFAD